MDLCGDGDDDDGALVLGDDDDFSGVSPVTYFEIPWQFFPCSMWRERTG